MAVDHHLVMQMRTRRKAARAQESEDLALLDPQPFLDAACEAGHVIIGGYIPVGVLDFDAAAIARVPSGLDDGSVAGGENWRADRRSPIDAGVHLGVTEDRMTTIAEAGTHLAPGDRFAHQEFARRAAVLVIKVEQTVIRGLETV